MKQARRSSLMALYLGVFWDTVRGATRAWLRRGAWIVADLTRDVAHAST